MGNKPYFKEKKWDYLDGFFKLVGVLSKDSAKLLGLNGEEIVIGGIFYNQVNGTELHPKLVGAYYDTRFTRKKDFLEDINSVKSEYKEIVEPIKKSKTFKGEYSSYRIFES